jgi:dihydroneopterin aldolase
MLTTIFIDQLQVHAPIGWFEEERTSKVTLAISVKVKYNSMHLGDELNNTIDYGTISAIVLQVSKVETKLLETLAQRIIQQIEAINSNDLVHVWVCIRKNQIQAKGVHALAHGVEVEQSYL